MLICCLSVSKSAHLVKTADFLRRVDDLPTAGTLGVHPPNLLCDPAGKFHLCYRDLVLPKRSVETSHRPPDAVNKVHTLTDTVLLLQPAAATVRAEAGCCTRPRTPLATSWWELPRRKQEIDSFPSKLDSRKYNYAQLH